MRIALTAAFAIIAFSSSTAAEDCAEGMRPFEHTLNAACIPETPQRIVSFWSRADTVPLLDIGAPVVGTWFNEMDDGTIYVQGASDIFGQDFVDAANLTAVASGAGVDIEAVVALEPDLIISGNWQSDLHDQFAIIAPTVVLDDNLPYLERLAVLADAAGLSDVYQLRLDAYHARIELLRERVGDPSAITVSRLDIDDSGIWYYPNRGALDQVLTDAGFARPDMQAEAEQDVEGISLEEIFAFDGDVILTSYAPRWGQTIDALTDGWMSAGGGLWRTLSGVREGNHYWYERDVWTGYSFRSLDIVIDGLILITAGRTFE